MTGDDYSGGPLDIATLRIVAQRANTHPVVDGWKFQPDHLSLRRLKLSLDAEQYPDAVETVRLDIRWFGDGTYTVHYLESRTESRWQCRWDRHPKPDGPLAHFHPPPDAASDIESSDIEADHHLEVLFAVLDWVEKRMQTPSRA